MKDLTPDQDNIKLLRKIKEEQDRLISKHDSIYFSFIGFIVAISGILLGYDNLIINIKYILGISIISLSASTYLLLWDSDTAIKKTVEMYKITSIAMDEDKLPSQGIQSIGKLSSIETMITHCATRLSHIGILLFLIGISYFVISLNN